MVFAEAPRERGATWAFPPGPERLKPYEPEQFNSAKLKVTGPVSLTRILSPPAPTCNARRSVRLSPLDRNGREALESSASVLSFANSQASPWSVPWQAPISSPSASKRSSTSVPAAFVHCGAPASPSGILKPSRYSSRLRQRKDGQSFAEIENSAAESWLTQSLRKESETTSAFELDCASASTTQATCKPAMKTEDADEPKEVCKVAEAKREDAPAIKVEEQPDTTLFPIEAPPKDQPVAHMWFSLDDLEAKIKEIHKEEARDKLMLDAEEVQSADIADAGVPLDAEVPTRVRPGEFLLWEPDEDIEIAAEDMACCTAGNAVDAGLRDFLAEAWLDSEFNDCFVEEEEV